jgi:hypothetical protein
LRRRYPLCYQRAERELEDACSLRQRSRGRRPQGRNGWRAPTSSPNGVSMAPTTEEEVVEAAVEDAEAEAAAAEVGEAPEEDRRRGEGTPLGYRFSTLGQ